MNSTKARLAFKKFGVVMQQRAFQNSVHVAEEMDDLRRTRQQRKIALDDDPVKTVVYKSEQAAKQLENTHLVSAEPWLRL